jgi:hypothetical protein
MTNFTPPAIEVALGLLAERPAGETRELEAALARTLALEPDEAHRALAAARTRWSALPACFYPCGGDDCRRAGGSELIWEHDLGGGSPCGLLPTGCQGACARGPVATLRVGDRVEYFGPIPNARAAQEIARFALRAASEQSLLADPGDTGALRFDPAHQARARAPSSPIDFLAGHFRGRGSYAAKAGFFLKEVWGSWDAGGQVLSLRMGVSYPLADGRHDSHTALVVLEPRDAARAVGRAYGDGGGIREYEYEIAPDGTIAFSDRPPGHGHPSVRARKRLVPHHRGYEEILEVGAGGRFEVYSRVSLRRLDACP